MRSPSHVSASLASAMRHAVRSLALGLAAGALLCVAQPSQAAAPPAPNPRLTMIVENRGTITLELYPKAAPKTVAHFLELVNKKFYDGIKFHRIVPNFVVQGGDPETKNVPVDQFDAHQVGTHGSGKTVPLEVKMSHEKGTLGLARSQAPDSGDSQFFINLVNNVNLDEGYCVFGKVIKGMDVVEKIKMGDVIKSLRVIAPEKPKH